MARSRRPPSRRAAPSGLLAALAGLLAALVAVGCLEVPAPAAKGGLDVRDVETADGMELSAACVPTGVELCFDAIDNNCNGVIDEGCGLRTGLLQFTVAWQEAGADVDLNVTGPDGDVAHLDQPNESGLMKDRDCPGTDDACYGQNVENVFLAEGNPRRGRYRVVVRLENPADASGPVKVRLSARIGQRHFSTVVELADKHDQRELEFSL